MTTMVDETAQALAEAEEKERRAQLVKALRDGSLGIQFSKTFPPEFKRLTKDQEKRAAEQFGADAKWFKGRKQLIDQTNEKVKAASNIVREAYRFWKAWTMDYPGRDQVRLAPAADLEDFRKAMDKLQAKLAQAADEAEEIYQTKIIPDSSKNLDRLFDKDDYPATIKDKWTFSWEVVSLDPPEYLARISPRIYAEHTSRIAACFDEALANAEDAFRTEFVKLVGKLAERLAPGPDGKNKILKDSAIDNLQEFIRRFQRLSIGSDRDMEDLVKMTKQALRDVTGERVRKDSNVRTTLRDRVAELSDKMSQEIVTVDRVIDLEEEE
jgi:hypothetical protein